MAQPAARPQKMEMSMPIQLVPSTSFMTYQVRGMQSTAQSAAAK